MNKLTDSAMCRMIDCAQVKAEDDVFRTDRNLKEPMSDKHTWRLWLSRFDSYLDLIEDNLNGGDV